MRVLHWKAGAAGAYLDPANWVEGVAPGPGDTAIIGDPSGPTFYPASVNAQRSRSADARRDMHSAPGRGLVIARQNGALVSHQPLSVFEHAKLLEDADHDVTVCTDAKAVRSG